MVITNPTRMKEHIELYGLNNRSLGMTEVEKAVVFQTQNCFNVDKDNVKYLYVNMVVQMERALLHTVLKNVKFNKSKAAKVLGINRATLYKKLKYLNVIN